MFQHANLTAKLGDLSANVGEPMTHFTPHPLKSSVESLGQNGGQKPIKEAVDNSIRSPP
jgi:hypothetical protein